MVLIVTASKKRIVEVNEKFYFTKIGSLTYLIQTEDLYKDMNQD